MNTNTNNQANVNEANRQIDNLRTAGNHIMTVHYACTGLNGTSSPRVTAIGVHNLHTGETKTFSIKKSAETSGVRGALSNAQKDKFEERMIIDFKNFISRSTNYVLVHWCMKDSTYGFEVIERRLRQLGNKPRIKLIPKSVKYDLNSIIQLLHTRNFVVNGTKGKLLTLAESNNLSTTNAKSGEDEVLLFNAGEYQKLEQSLIAKVNAIAGILRLVLANSLIVNDIHPRSSRFRWRAATMLSATAAAIWALVRFIFWQRVEASAQKPLADLGKSWDLLIDFFKSLV